jgi:hypothetical protein
MKSSCFPNCQQIYLSVEGHVLASCDTLFLTPEKINDTPLQNEIPFLQSMWQNLITPDFPFYKDFSIEGVFLNIGSKNGYFDVHFMKILLDNQEALFWYLQDKTSLYHNAIKEQQISNEAYIGTDFVSI